MGALRVIAAHGKLALVVGLMAGLFLPGLAQVIRPFIPHLIAALLMVTAARVGWRDASGGLRGVAATLVLVVVYQVAMPLAVAVPAAVLGVTGVPLVMAVCLLLAAPSVTGAPNFAILLGQDPAPAMRLLILGTLVFPVTVLPVLWLLPQVSGFGDLAGASARFAVLIGGAAMAGFVLREVCFARLGDDGRAALDGVAAVLLAVVVVGLMSAIGPALAADPWRLAGWAVVAVAVNFGLQVGAALVMGQGRATPARAIVAGNRNIALMLLALPEEITTPLLIFIGCYQIPMYLTPVVMRDFYRRLA